MDSKEIEIKLEIDKNDYIRLKEFLKEFAAFKASKRQIDVYYSPANESYYDCGDRCLRVRTEGSNTILSYKRIFDENTNKQFIEEYETKVDSFEVIDHILKAVNFRCDIIVDKYREEYLSETGFMIALDKVVDLGFFVEIENCNETDSLKKRNQDLISVVEQLHLDTAMRNTEGYSNMLYRKSHLNGGN